MAKSIDGYLIMTDMRQILIYFLGFLSKSGRQNFRMSQSGWHFNSGRYGQVRGLSSVYFRDLGTDHSRCICLTMGTCLPI